MNGHVEDSNNQEIHWFAIILSFALVTLLVFFVCLVLARILKKDFSLSSDIENDYCTLLSFFLEDTHILIQFVRS